MLVLQTAWGGRKKPRVTLAGIHCKQMSRLPTTVETHWHLPAEDKIKTGRLDDYVCSAGRTRSPQKAAFHNVGHLLRAETKTADTYPKPLAVFPRRRNQDKATRCSRWFYGPRRGATQRRESLCRTSTASRYPECRCAPGPPGLATIDRSRLDDHIQLADRKKVPQEAAFHFVGHLLQAAIQAADNYPSRLASPPDDKIGTRRLDAHVGFRYYESRSRKPTRHLGATLLWLNINTANYCRNLLG